MQRDTGGGVEGRREGRGAERAKKSGGPTTNKNRDAIAEQEEKEEQSSRERN